MTDTHVLVFGDSITYGAWDVEGGWVQRLRKQLDRKTLAGKGFYLVYNLGVSGDTTRDVLHRFENETKPRLSGEGETIIVFSIGTNDCLCINKTKKLQVPEKEFEKNIQTLVSLGRKYSKKIVFIGDTPVDESKMNPLPWAPQFSARNVYIA